MQLVLVLISIFFVTLQAFSPSFRLSRDVLPKSYNLKIVPELKTDSFSGEVTILLNVKYSIKVLKLNAKGLKIRNVVLDQSFGETEYILDPGKELIEIYYNDQKQIEPGEHILHIAFGGSLSGKGFYYVENKRSNESTGMFVTKFSPISARTVFPCFDEPFFKSIFSVRLIKPDKKWTALSNMKEIGSFETEEGIAVDFQSTVPMSTYLLAWVLTEYSSESDIFTRMNGEIVEMRFFTMNQRSSYRREALDVSKKFLEYFENYTTIEYPLSKLDSIEIPHYRSRGMEHWGLIVYHENSITFNNYSITSELFHSIESKLLLAHEISHMWFGNLVTHEWYNDLWLTEGFARFMQYKAAQHVLGHTFFKDLFQRTKRLSLFKDQCDEKYFVLETAFYSRNFIDIFKKYSSSSYDQGAAVLMMLEDLIGEEKFMIFVRKFLRKHEYRHATTGDFMNEIQEFVPTINLRNFMETFLFQRKLPLIHVNENKEHFILHQTTICKTYGENTIFRNKWTVPIKYITSSSQKVQTVWFDRDMTKVVIPKIENDEWIKINHMNRGLYGSLYSEKIYKKLLQNFKSLTPQDQGSLIEETFYLSTNEMLNCSIPLLFLNEFKKLQNIDFLMFTYASRSTLIFSRFLKTEKDVGVLLEAYFTHIFEPVFHNISWTEGGTLEQRLLRISVLESFCLFKFQHKQCLLEAERLKSKNIDVDRDIEYINSAILENVKKYYSFDNSTSSETSQSSMLESAGKTDEISEYQKECSLWIRENIPKIMSQTNMVS